jgi:CheY-like chemotaxis protein
MKKRLLIIDNDKQLNKINEKILHMSGMVKELHITCNGREALEYLVSRVQKDYPLPDIIVLDIEMPVLNGFEFIDEFNQLDFPGKSNIELVIFTSSSNPRDKQKASLKGIKHYLSKPYLLRGLSDIIFRLDIEQSDLYHNRKPFGLERSMP